MISLIVCMDNNNTIGRNNDLPWKLPADLKYFKETTMGKPILMGRKTYESIGRPLPGRKNYVLTRDKTWSAPNVTVVTNIESIEKLERDNELFIIGGAEIYKQYINKADRLYVTKINHTFEGDARFPTIEQSLWQLVNKKDGIVDDSNKYEHAFYVYKRK
jgi:dihydrofolate reductase